MKLSESEALIQKLYPLVKQYQEVEEFARDSSLDHLPDFEIDYLHTQHLKIADLAADLARKIGYLNKPFIAKGYLELNSQGRYQITGTSHYFTSGSSIEIWDSNNDCFIPTSIEHSNNRYYAVALPNLDLTGVLARTK